MTSVFKFFNQYPELQNYMYKTHFHEINKNDFFRILSSKLYIHTLYINKAICKILNKLSKLSYNATTCSIQHYNIFYN